MTTTIRAPFPPSDGQEWEGQCAGCGSDINRVRCEDCGGDGLCGHDCGEDTCCCLHPEDNVTCGTCDGHGHWWICVLPFHECECDEIEWFVVPRGAVEHGGEA